MHTICEQFNLLYVATTRACEALYILRIPIRYDKKDILKNLAEASGIAIPSEWGTLPRKQKPQQTQSEDIPFTPKPHTTPWHPMLWLPKLKIAKTNPNEEAERAKEMGWLVHECLQFVRYQDDIGKTCEDALQFVLTYHTPKYPVTKPMQKKIKTSLQWFLQQEQSRTWLANGWREQILMQEDGSLARCDLLVPTNDTWLVVDYRSGRANRTHQREIKKFCDLLTKKGISCMGVLVYLDRQCFQVINGTKLSECQRTFQQCLA